MNFLFFAALAVAPEPQIEPFDDGYRITVEPFAVEEERDVSARINEMMKQTCGDLFAEGLQFGFQQPGPGEKIDGPEMVDGYFQTFRCVDPSTRPDIADFDLPENWEPSDVEEETALDVARRFLALLDEGRGDEALELALPDALGSREDFLAGVAERQTETGPLNRKILLTSWYLHPQGAPRGAYVAFDFYGQSDATALDCGNVVLRRLGDGSYEILRMEETTVSEGQGLADKQIEAIRQQYCRAWL